MEAGMPGHASIDELRAAAAAARRAGIREEERDALIALAQAGSTWEDATAAVPSLGDVDPAVLTEWRWHIDAGGES
jgi:hypothetical protein